MGRPLLAQGRQVGVIEKGVIRKKVDAQRHQLRVPPAWALDAESFEVAVLQGVTAIELIDDREGVVWTSTVENFIEKGGQLDRGYGRQYYLPLEFWEKHDVSDPDLD